MNKAGACMLLFLLPLNPVSTGDRESSIPAGEKYRVFCDRNYYVAGEDILFRVFNLSSEQLKELEWSTVFYLELVSPAGKAYARTKVMLDSGGAEGSLGIPGDVPSGTFYLKGYTRWLRNLEPSSYSFSSLKIINPFRTSLLPIDTLPASWVDLSRPSAHAPYGSPQLQIKKDTLQPRDTARLWMVLQKGSPPLSACITVTRREYLGSRLYHEPSASAAGEESLSYIPESRGISLTGQVLYKDRKKPVPYAVVYLSMLGEHRDFVTNYTDSAGRFYFALPAHQGSAEMFISANLPGQPEPVDLYVEQDFCQKPLRLPSYPLPTKNGVPEWMRELSVNAQIMEQYDPANVSGKKEVQVEERLFFYGSPRLVVDFDQYINLPTLEEYLSEVTPNVHVRRANRTQKITISGEHPDLDFFDPLLMIDGIAIFDTEALLDLPPKLIDRLEIVDAPYQVGNVTFGGILNVVTNAGNLGAVDLPSSGLLIEYMMVDREPETDGIRPPPSPLWPDFRNTVYWEPCLRLNPGALRRIDLRCCDREGDYVILVRGFDASGRYRESSAGFSVRQIPAR